MIEIQPAKFEEKQLIRRLLELYSHDLSEYEGSICTPFIAYWIEVITNKGKINRQPVHFVDIMATVSNITGASYPASFNGERIIPLQGESLLPALQGKMLPKRDKPIFFEFRSGGAVRDGKWKLVTKSIPKKPKNPLKDKVTWELYDMSADVTEMEDLAKQNPEAVQRLSQLWQNWYAEAYGF